MFSGCGGLDLGFQKNGFNILYANELDKDTAYVYRDNIGEIDCKSILDVDLSNLPKSDVFLAGFPCQPFSSAGARKGTEDDRGNLYLTCLEYIDIHKPKVVLFENVQGILSTKNLDGSNLLDSIVSLLEASGEGYKVQYKLILADRYEVPQKRKRVIIVGVAKSIQDDFIFPEEIPFSEALLVGSIIQGVEGLPNQDDLFKLSPQVQRLVPFIKEGGSWKDIPYEELPERLKKIRDNMKKYKSPTFLRRFARNEINGTITASAMPEKCGILHPTEDRRYTVREVARIQSFPDDFVFNINSIQKKYKMIGNAVPPKLAFHLAKSVKSLLDKEAIECIK